MPRAWIRPFPAMAALCFLVLSLIGSAIILSFPLRPHPEATSDRPPSPSTRLDDQHQRVVLEPILLSDTAELSHSFTLRNHAGHVLTFKKPMPGCGCSTASLEPQRLAPDESAKLSVSVRLPKGCDGVKEIMTSLMADSGEAWHFRLVIPVVAEIVAPSRIAVRPNATSSAADSGTAGECRVQVRALQTGRLSQFALSCFSSRSGVRSTILRHIDSVGHAADAPFFCREYVVKLDLPSMDAGASTIEWTFDHSKALTFLDVVAPPVVVIDPKQIIIHDRNASLCRITLTFPDATYSASLLRHPEFLVPTSDASRLSSLSSSINFAVRIAQAQKPTDEIVFQVFRNGNAVAKLHAPVISLLALKKEGA
jgi:hypothetical protein